jgi:hypothetical protein
VLYKFGVVDDHNNFGLIERTDGKILALGTGHTVMGYFSRISSNAGDIKSWGAITNISAQLGSTGHTYSNPVRLSDGIYLFYRGQTNVGGEWSCHMTVSTDEGATWATATKITTGNRPYFRLTQDGDKIWFMTNDEHPGDAGPNNLYLCYRDPDGNWFDRDGSPLTLPITPLTDLAPVWDAAVQGYDAWARDIAVDPTTGHVVMVYSVFVDTVSDHRYRYCRVNPTTGAVIRDVELCTAGAAIEGNSSGDVCLDPLDPNIVIASRESGGVYTLSRFVTADEGQSFTETVLTDGVNSYFRMGFVYNRTQEPRLASLRCQVSPFAYQYVDFNNDIVLLNSQTGAE